MELIYSELSSPGPARENNEDFVGFWQPESLEEKRSLGAVAVLADGVGGLSHGEVASRLAVETALKTFREAPGEQTPQQLITQMFNAANLAVYNKGMENHGKSQMATTLAIAVLRNNEIVVGQCRRFARLPCPQGRDQAVVHRPYLYRHAAKVRPDFRTGRQDQRKPLHTDAQRRA